MKDTVFLSYVLEFGHALHVNCTTVDGERVPNSWALYDLWNYLFLDVINSYTLFHTFDLLLQDLSSKPKIMQIEYSFKLESCITYTQE